MTSTDGLLNAIADYFADLEDMRDEYAPKVAQRFGELLKNPEQMNDGLAEQFLDAEMSLTDLSVDFWDTVAEGIEMGFDALHTVPVMDRGEAWQMAREMIIAIAYRQALIESGLIQASLIRGTRLGQVKRGMRTEVNPRLITGANMKQRIKDARANRGEV